MTDRTPGAPPSSDGWARRRSRVSAHIETVALRLFAEHGYTNVTLTSVAAAAGVSPRTLTRYFPLKEDLLLSLPRRSGAVALEALAQGPTGKHAVVALWDMWISLARRHRDELEPVRLWYRAAQTAPHALGRSGAEMTELVRGNLISVAAAALEVPSDDLQAKVLAAALAAALETVFERWLVSNGRENLDELFAAALVGLRQGFGSAAMAAGGGAPARGPRSSRCGPGTRNR
jgi:AcrR family transcriptional regulator